MTTENRQKFTIKDLEALLTIHGVNVSNLKIHPAQVGEDFPFPEHITFRQSEGYYFDMFALILPNGDILEYGDTEDINQEGLVFTQEEYRVWVAQEWPEDAPILTFGKWRLKHQDLVDQIPEGL